VISSKDLRQLPDPATLRRLTRSLAMLDAILSPEVRRLNPDVELAALAQDREEIGYPETS
jgi:hypothetical protein